VGIDLQVLFFSTLIIFDSSRLNSFPASLDERNRLSPFLYWGTLISGSLGCVIGFVLGKLRDKSVPWFRYSINDFFLITLLLAIHLAIHQALYLIPLTP
jgi:hypothetical protein